MPINEHSAAPNVCVQLSKEAFPGTLVGSQKIEVSLNSKILIGCIVTLCLFGLLWIIAMIFNKNKK